MVNHVNPVELCSALPQAAYLQPSYRQVVIFCPENVSGGPEALHQLAFRINRNGGSAAMAYTGPRSWCRSIQDTLFCVYDPACRMLEHYSSYSPHIAEEVALDTKTLLVFPEVMAQEAIAFRSKSSKAIWWLSVDNALKYNEQLREVEPRLQFFADPSVVHFYQSEYAAHFLLSNRARKCVSLSDFIDQAFFAGRSLHDYQQRRLICFFPRKGGGLAEEFLATFDVRAEGCAVLPLANMSRIAIIEALSRANVYIDFGHHPGKDRVPREAAAAGAIVMLHRKGAANFFIDHALDEEYLFDTEEVASGALATKVREIMQDPLRHVAKQELYRQVIRLEAEKFDLEVRTFFFRELAKKLHT